MAITSILPADEHRLVFTDTGLETDLIFHHGLDLPHFAAYPLLDDARGRELLLRYFRDHVAVALAAGVAIVLETPTWRANRDWGARLGHDAADLDRYNRDAVALLEPLRDDAVGAPVWISGCLGPRGDGYVVDDVMTVDDAREYHRPQVMSLAAAGADVVSILTVTYAAEGAGVIRAAADIGIPAVVSLTVETDGRLPDGTRLGDAVEEIDYATDGAAMYFAVNCAHPEHIGPGLEAGVDGSGDWLDRIRGIRVNASRMSHAELDAAEELDDGVPAELAAAVKGLHLRFPSISVLGGCCGTDVRHLRAISDALRA
jgi:homocysteine S-methyltransferase